ncbi:MAG: hypothetical protein Q7I94_07835, partial [Candidatus Contubernalis sp.]|nr:hypothetical protein [Candidatus Contubernalis sp.]
MRPSFSKTAARRAISFGSLFFALFSPQAYRLENGQKLPSSTRGILLKGPGVRIPGPFSILNPTISSKPY